MVGSELRESVDETMNGAVEDADGRLEAQRQNSGVRQSHCQQTSQRTHVAQLHTSPTHTHIQASGWLCGVVVSGVIRMNEVNARRARLVPGWVTVFGRVYHLGM